MPFRRPAKLAPLCGMLSLLWASAALLVGSLLVFCHIWLGAFLAESGSFLLWSSLRIAPYCNALYDCVIILKEPQCHSL